MTYFELFNIPVSLLVDASSIKKRFYELSRKYHPDFFSNASSEEQEDALEMSALLNKALKVLSNTDETIKYVLQLKGLLEEDEKYQLPNDFLMDVMDINEQLMDAKMEGNEDKMVSLKQQIVNLQTEIYEPVKNIVENYQEGITSQKELLQVKKYYFQKKYLDRMLSGISF
ncbi:MAG: iron-sulfur cluster co-chaperone HscB C-terminal domain-containing protein [Alphaproteobacteria bacterium]